MDVKEIVTEGCCGKSQITLQLSKPLSLSLIKNFTDNGFLSAKKYSDIGIIYIENDFIIANGSIGSNLFDIKNKNDNYLIGLNKLKELLKVL
jgi:hypothetical protein